MQKLPPDSTSRPESVPYEQAVYGSFPFWDQGYAILAQSPGCRPEWLADFRVACQRYGERPPGAAESPALFCLRLPSGPWAIVGVFPQGRDDAGRPGAMAFHSIFVKGSDYRRAGASPFAFASALHDGWTAETRELPSGRHPLPDPFASLPEIDPTAQSIARAIGRGRRVLVESATPIDELAPRVWSMLPSRLRSRASVATWAFSPQNDYDLAALPRVHLPTDRPFVDLATLLTEAETAEIDAPSAHRLVRRLVWLVLAVVGASAVVLSWWGRQ